MEIMKDDGISCFNLPPGFLFSPTDEELVLHFLYPKATSLHHQRPSHPNIIPHLDISLTDPWELNNGNKALASGNQYYFYTKVNNDENRRTENGYWKEIGVMEPIISSSSGAEKKKVGMKKYLVFHIGEGLTDDETNWVMQEYHHVWSSHGFDDTTSTSTASSHWSWSSSASGRPKHDHQSWSRWVLCRVYQKNSRSEEQDVINNCSSDHHDDDDDSGTELSWLDEVYLSLDIDDDHLEEEEEITMHA